MSSGSPGRTEVLRTSIQQILRQVDVRVEEWRSGTDFWADLVYDGPELVGVARSARVERIETSYDGLVDFGDVLVKEALATDLLREFRVPVPQVLHLQRARFAEDVSWSLAQFIESDDGTDVSPDLRQLGRLTRRLHGIQPGSAWLRPSADWAGFFTRRLSRRLSAAARYADVPADAGFLERVNAALGTRDHLATSLLHMDLREENLCLRSGDIVGVLDLANCMVGDPLLELARIRAYGLLNHEFLDGYGFDRHFDEIEETLLDIYRLDTEALLVAVAVEELDDAEFQQQKIRQTQLLCDRLAQIRLQ
jgi:hypothetical protein